MCLALEGSGGMLPQENLKFRPSESVFGTFKTINDSTH